MEEILVIAALGAFFAAALTVPAGFGLSTMLTPFALLLMPPHEAVAVVAVVHGAHNAAKMLEYVGFGRPYRFPTLWCLVSNWRGIGCHSSK